jgi:hypothetical protein
LSATAISEANVMNASLRSVSTQTDAERRARGDLAACYPLAVHFGLNGGIDALAVYFGLNGGIDALAVYFGLNEGIDALKCMLDRGSPDCAS